MSTFKDSDGDEFEAIKSGCAGEKPLIDLLSNGSNFLTFYAEDSERIIELIREAAK